jgi:hypothetical protein
VVPDAVRRADGKEVLGITGSVRARWERSVGDIELDADPGKECDPVRVVEFVPEIGSFGGLESRRGRYAGVKTPAKASCISFPGVGGVNGCFSDPGNAPSSLLPRGSPGVGGLLDTDFRGPAGEVGDGGEPAVKTGGSRVWPLMLNFSTPVVGLLSGTDGRGVASASV